MGLGPETERGRRRRGDEEQKQTHNLAIFVLKIAHGAKAVVGLGGLVAALFVWLLLVGCC